MLFGEQRIWCSHSRWIDSGLYPVLSPKHKCLKLKKLHHLSSCSSHTGHLTCSFPLHKKVPELSVDRSPNNRGLWNLSLPILYPLQAPTHKPSQEAQETRSLLVLLQACLQMPENPEVTHLRARSPGPCGKQGRGTKTKLVSMNPASNKCRLFLGRFG